MKTRWRRWLLLATASMLPAFSGTATAQLLITGNDEKQIWDASGKQVNNPPGKDTVSIIDIRDRVKPRIIANLPLMNTVVGPPTNLAITPDQKLALVANSLDWVKEGENWKGQPDNKLYVIDLATSPPQQIATVELGKQPSGMAINRAGNLALVANRADDTVSVLSINGKDVKVVDTVSVSAGTPNKEQPSAVAITPDGKRALVAKFTANKVAVLAIDGQKVTYTKYDMATGLYPYNVAITPDGKLAIAGNNGGAGSSDGQVDTAAIIDLEADPPRVIDQVVVGDGPEGLAMSPVGGYAAEIILNGSNLSHDKFFYHPHSYVSLLKIDAAKKKVWKVAEAEVGGLAEGTAFSPDGKFLYVGNFLDSDVTILRLQGDKLKTVGRLQLPGHPASMRGSTP
jgi:DNA-binding beta-propeller fold protein YncE